MLKIIFDGQLTATATIKIACRKKRIDGVSIFLSQLLTPAEGFPDVVGLARVPIVVGLYNGGISLRVTNASSLTGGVKEHVHLTGNFNYDEISILSASEEFKRIEIRNEYDVLITDNGKPWDDGTYPPDAKNRADLAGLHAAPAVINPELEAALMGDATNEERAEE